jgi:hypothetical protein
LAWEAEGLPVHWDIPNTAQRKCSGNEKDQRLNPKTSEKVGEGEIALILPIQGRNFSRYNLKT